jgi:hypothetical protein
MAAKIVPLKPAGRTSRSGADDRPGLPADHARALLSVSPAVPQEFRAGAKDLGDDHPGRLGKAGLAVGQSRLFAKEAQQGVGDGGHDRFLLRNDDERATTVVLCVVLYPPVLVEHVPGGVLHRLPRCGVEAEHLADPRPRRVVAADEGRALAFWEVGEGHVVPLALHPCDDRAKPAPGVEPAVKHGDLGRLVADLEEAERGAEQGTAAAQFHQALRRSRPSPLRAQPSALFSSGQTSALQCVPVIPRMRQLTRSHGCCHARSGSSGMAERVEEPIAVVNSTSGGPGDDCRAHDYPSRLRYGRSPCRRLVRVGVVAGTKPVRRPEGSRWPLGYRSGSARLSGV